MMRKTSLICLIFVLIFLIFGFKEGNGQGCPARNDSLASLVGRQCRKACNPVGNQCKEGLQCLCARECGYSCINIGKICNLPTSVPNMKHIKITRVVGGQIVNATPPYKFDDLAVYECNPEYTLKDPKMKHYCNGRKKWTNAGKNTCISKYCNLTSTIPNMKRIKVTRVVGSQIVNATSPYQFDDLAVYECNLGYTLKDPKMKHYCQGRNYWTNAGQSACIWKHCKKTCSSTHNKCGEGEQCVCEQNCDNSCIKSNCPARNVSLALLAGRRCRKACSPGCNQCKEGMQCLCAQECGYSCIKMENNCKLPVPISNMKRIKITRVLGSHIVNATPPYKFDDLAVYECNPGYTLKDPKMKHHCSGRKRWTYDGQSICVLSCQSQNWNRILAARSSCLSECDTDDDCNGTQRCVCDSIGSRSCSNPETNCTTPYCITNMKGIQIGNTKTPPYISKDFINYKCNPGYTLRDPGMKHYCYGKKHWNHAKNSICI